MLVGPELGQVVSADVASLSRGLRTMVRDRGRLERMASAARKTYEAQYRPDVVTRQLLAIYNEVIDTKEAAR
jgi:glycosyltransferase involved in cell wall biosynthesis